MKLHDVQPSIPYLDPTKISGIDNDLFIKAMLGFADHYNRSDNTYFIGVTTDGSPVWRSVHSYNRWKRFGWYAKSDITPWASRRTGQTKIEDIEIGVVIA